MFYVLLFVTSLTDVVRAREKARGDTNGISQIPSEEEEEEEIKQEYLAVARLFLPPSNLLLPSTVYILLGTSP